MHMNLKIGAIKSEKTQEFKYLDSILTIKNRWKRENEIKARLQVGNTCYYESLKLLKKQKHEWHQEICTEKIQRIRVSGLGKERREKGSNLERTV